MDAVLYKIPGVEWQRLGGMSLLERNLRLLDAAGVKRALVLVPPGDRAPSLSIPRPLHLERQTLNIAADEKDLLSLPLDLGQHDLGTFLFYNANLLIDPRLIETFRNRNAPCLLVKGQAEGSNPVWQVGLFDPQHLVASEDLLNIADRMGTDEVSHYDPEVRGDVVPYCEKIDNAASARLGWRLLIKRAQKRPGDFIEKYVHPEIQNWTVKRICNTPITPNQISFLVVVSASAAAVFFYIGSFFLAWFAAFVATVLDGVDGKLARVKLMTSKVGKLEHVFDYFYENAWYLCLAAHLAQWHGFFAWKVGLAVTACDTANKIIGGLFGKYTGKTLDEMSQFDRDFRLIGGRRSIYIFILLIGFLFQVPFPAFQVVLLWAAFTVTVQACRAVYHALKTNSPAT